MIVQVTISEQGVTGNLYNLFALLNTPNGVTEPADKFIMHIRLFISIFIIANKQIFCDGSFITSSRSWNSGADWMAWRKFDYAF